MSATPMGLSSVGKPIRWPVTLSVLMIVAGLLVILVPPAAGIAVTLLVGWLLVFSGLMYFVYLAYAQHRCNKRLDSERLIGLPLATQRSVYGLESSITRFSTRVLRANGSACVYRCTRKPKWKTATNRHGGSVAK